MGQIEVYDLLKRERLTGNDRFLSVTEVEKLMKAEGYTNGCIKTVRWNLLRLEESGYLEFKMSGKWSDWKRLYRIKDKYLGGN